MKINYQDFIRPGKDISDIMPLFREGEVFSQVIDEMVKPFMDVGVDKVVGIEARGFILAGAVAYRLKSGVVAVRKAGRLPGKVISKEIIDYSGKVKVLEIQQDAIDQGERVIIVDDWFESGNQAKATAYLVEKLGGKIVGFSVIVDETNNKTKEFLNRYGYYYLYQDK